MLIFIFQIIVTIKKEKKEKKKRHKNYVCIYTHIIYIYIYTYIIWANTWVIYVISAHALTISGC